MTSRTFPTIRARQYVDIGGSFRGTDTSLAVRVFGVLADLTFPIVEQYRSDLFHDARWLAEHCRGPMTFYYGCDAWGTEIGADYVSGLDSGRRNLWRVDVERDAREHYSEPRMWTASADGYDDAPAHWRVVVTPIRLDVERAA